MISLTYEDLSTPLTRDQALQNLLDFLSMQGFAATSWGAGEPIRDILEAIADRDALKSSEVAFLMVNRFNPTATDERMMEKIAKSDFDNDRIAALAARHDIVFALDAEEAAVPVAVGDLVVSTQDETQTYRNIEAGTIPSGGSVTLEVEAEKPGAAGDAAINTITRMVTTIAGCACNNPSPPTRYGRNIESIEALRLRNVQRWPTLSLENTSASLEYYIKTMVPEITSVVVDDSNPRGAGTVDIYCAKSLDLPSDGNITSATTVARSRFFNPDPRIQVFKASAQVWNPVGTVLYSPSHDASTVQVNVIGALRAVLIELPIGGRSYTNSQSHVLMRDDVIKAVRAVPGVINFALQDTADYVVGRFSKLLQPVSWSITYLPTSVS